MSDFNTEIKQLFEQNGAHFLCSSQNFITAIHRTKTFIFDWDGVFNAGVKADGNGSPFSEVDSMGLNMLRFSYYLKYNFIPDIYVVTGENNAAALHLSKREHFTAVYLKAKQKKQALDHLLADAQFGKQEVAFMFDDILDLGLAAEVGLRLYIQRTANPILSVYIRKNTLAEYITANDGANNAVREVCELAIATLDNFDEVVHNRIQGTQQYQRYLEERNRKNTLFYKFENDQITEFNFSQQSG